MQLTPPKNPVDDLAGDLSLLDLIGFIQESWKTIAGLILLGIAGATLYLWTVPKQYEAIAQIRILHIAQMGKSIDSRGIPIEEPDALISRMTLPTSYSKDATTLCGLADEKGAQAALASKVMLRSLKGVGGTVELKIRGASKETAEACVKAVYQLIKTAQADLVAPSIDEAKKKLRIVEERLSSVTQSIGRADKLGVPVTVTYLLNREEIHFLPQQISNLRDFITSNESRATELIAPIYVYDQPVFPKKRNIFLIGLLLGGFTGLVLALARKFYRSNLVLKTEAPKPKQGSAVAR